MDLSPFKYHDRFLMLALDHRGSFKKYISKNPEAVTVADSIKAKAMIINSLADQFSGVLLDPSWGLTAYQGGAKPYLLCLEKTGYVESGSERVTELEYTAKQLKELGASGTKLLLYFNPEAKSRVQQIETATKALLDSHKNKLPLFLEIVTYGNEASGKSRAEWVLRSVKMLLETGVVPDVWKLEFPASVRLGRTMAGRPGDFEACKKITELVGDTPWILLTRGESFEMFREQLKVAVAAGAVGFLAGRALWQEFGQYPDEAAQKEFLTNTVKPRFAEISRIVLANPS